MGDIQIKLESQESAQRWPNFILAISNHLRSESIPNLIFDSYALTLHGIVSGFAGASFVIPDDSVDAASQALKKAGLELDPEAETKSIQPNLQITINEDQHAWSRIKFFFYGQSQVLWEIQPLRTLPDHPTQDVVHVYTGARTVTTPDTAKDNVIYVPSISRLLRAWILLAIRAEMEFKNELESNHWLDRYTNAADVLQEKNMWNAELEKEVSGKSNELEPMIDWINGKIAGKQAWDETVSRVVAAKILE